MVLVACIPKLSRSPGPVISSSFHSLLCSIIHNYTILGALSWHRGPEGCKGERTDHETKLLFSGLSMANKVSGQDVYLLQEENADCSRFPNFLTFFSFILKSV